MVHDREFDESTGITPGRPVDRFSSRSRAGSDFHGADVLWGSLIPGGQLDPAMAEVVEEFTRRVQTGEHVDLEDYVEISRVVRHFFVSC